MALETYARLLLCELALPDAMIRALRLRLQVWRIPEDMRSRALDRELAGASLNALTNYWPLLPLAVQLSLTRREPTKLSYVVFPVHKKMPLAQPATGLLARTVCTHVTRTRTTVWLLLVSMLPPVN